MVALKDILRFENKFIPEPNSGCWLWLGAIGKNGYGNIHWEKKQRLAHRVSFKIHNGYLPSKSLDICHKCDVRSCVNPEHFFIGTRSDNMKDCVKKKRLRNTQITHCPQGHPYNTKNTYLYIHKGGPRRHCRTCLRIRTKRYQDKKHGRI